MKINLAPIIEQTLRQELQYTDEQMAAVWASQLIPNWMEHGERVVDYLDTILPLGILSGLFSMVLSLDSWDALVKGDEAELRRLIADFLDVRLEA